MIQFRFFLFAIVVLLQMNQGSIFILSHGARNENKIALTFDACPSSVRGGYDNHIVSILVDSGVPATFFLSGRWIQRHRSETKTLASITNFEIGNHSFTHPHMNAISDSMVRSEIFRTESLLQRVVGTSTHLFRPPYGETDTQIVHTAKELGLITVLYDLASGDPDSTISCSRLVNYVASQTRNGSIIVMHVNGHGWHTAEALPQIIRALRSKGFRFVKVSELLSVAKNSSKTRAK